MSEVGLYLDEDAMRRSLVFALRARSVDVVTAAEAAMISRADPEHLEFASSAGRTLFTHNTAHFCELHEQWLNRRREHAGNIVARQRYAVGEELRMILSLMARRTAEQMRNRLEFLSSWR